MNDKELLEMAAKAAGQERSAAGDLWSDARGQLWSPLTDDGDALRLAVKLNMTISTGPIHVNVSTIEGALRGHFFHESRILQHQDGDAATRRAIVRAAAEIGRSLP